MTDQILMDGEPLEVGDEVYCLLNGKGKVESINNKSKFPIEIAFPHGYCTYAKDFRCWTNQKNRTLYWQKPEIIPPPKPKKKVKKKVKVWDWFIEWETDDHQKPIVDRVNGLSEDEVLDIYPGALIQKIDGTEREVER